MVRNLQFEIPKEVVKIVKNINGTLSVNIKSLAEDNKKLNEPIINMYKRYIKERKVKDFEFTGQEFKEIVVSVDGHFQLFRNILVGMDGGRNNFRFYNSEKSVIVKFYNEILMHIMDLEEIWKNQSDVLRSGASMKQKTSAFISLFDEERKVYKGFIKSYKNIPTHKNIIRDFINAIKSGDIHAINGMIFALIIVVVVFSVLFGSSSIAFAAAVLPNIVDSVIGTADKVNNEWGVDMGRFAYIPSSIWYVFQHVGEFIRNRANDWPGITGLLQSLTVVQLWKGYRAGVPVSPFRGW